MRFAPRPRRARPPGLSLVALALLPFACLTVTDCGASPRPARRAREAAPAPTPSPAPRPAATPTPSAAPAAAASAPEPSEPEDGPGGQGWRATGGEVRCGAGACKAGKEVCDDDRCVPAEARLRERQRACDDASDCGPGRACCATHLGFWSGVACSDRCSVGDEALCNVGGDAPCPKGMRCVAASEPDRVYPASQGVCVEDRPQATCGKTVCRGAKPYCEVTDKGRRCVGPEALHKRADATWRKCTARSDCAPGRECCLGASVADCAFGCDDTSQQSLP
ncbi:MAG TPA: hypothetical protein VFS43_43380 [Polyangiaceae bacterium]|nr:hypothetical protein [Polyangiaceae bacterium]